MPLIQLKYYIGKGNKYFEGPPLRTATRAGLRCNQSHGQLESIEESDIGMVNWSIFFLVEISCYIASRI